MEYHLPVLSQETIDLLDVQSGEVYIDATLGNGGHTLEILKKGGIVYGIDQDPNNLKITQERIKKEGLGKNFFPIHSNFNKLEDIVKNQIKKEISGIIVDLGLSQNQQKSQNRGFSFNDTSSLDMRLDPENQEVTAEMVINTASFEDLYKVFTKYGQEVYSKPLILRIITERQKSPIKSGERLANIIRDYYKQRNIRTNTDPSTKIFMSLRILVNEEFENLRNLLAQTLTSIKSNGRVVIITFHSGEDRIVKQFIKNSFDNNLITNKSKSVKANHKEVSKNPLSRSATLRSYRII
ncbi:MAG: 16S rRNA (cytosine(1402)-N(4))-methyltransferase RsmH [Candidatus Shapirobacteria bacterium]